MPCWAVTLPVQTILLHAQPSGHMQHVKCTTMAWYCRRACQMARPTRSIKLRDGRVDSFMQL